MSKRQPINIKIRKNIEVNPDTIYMARVVSSGNGAVIKSYKQFIGKEAIIIIGEIGDKTDEKAPLKKEKDYEETVFDLTELGYELSDKNVPKYSPKDKKKTQKKAKKKPGKISKESADAIHDLTELGYELEH